MENYNCGCLEVAGMLNFTVPGKPISDCACCNGTGYITDEWKEKEKFLNLLQEIRDSKFPNPSNFRNISQGEWWQIVETCGAYIFKHPYYDFRYTPWGFDKFKEYISEWFKRIKI